MLIGRKNIGVLFFYSCGYSRIRNFLLRIQNKPVARFLAFHDVPKTSVNSFEVNMTFLKHYTNVVSLDDFMSGRLTFGKINVVITFDDGFKSWIKHAVPILRKLALPATFFISSGLVGLSKGDANIFSQSRLLRTKSIHQQNTAGLTREDVKQIADFGFTIGGHTLSHCNLSEQQEAVKLKYEIVTDKSILESLTGKKIKYFSYPFGNYQNSYLNITDVLIEAGYKAAVTTIPGFNTHYTNPFYLHRDPLLIYRGQLPPILQAALFKAHVYGNSDAIQWLKQIM